MPNGWEVGIDVGGTFTDVVAVKRACGEARAAKVATRTGDRVAGLLAALEAVSLDWSDVDDLIHGTTLITNAIIEDDLAKVALVATRGSCDTLEIGRQNRRHLYRLDLPPKAQPQVPSELRFEVSERIDHEGRVLEALDLRSVDEAVRKICASGADAVAVSLLHSYAEPAHEEALGERLRERIAFVALSSRVNPEVREYERSATTALCAGVLPLASTYLDQLEAAKPSGSRLHFFHSAGGMAAPDALRELPLGLAASGPAARVAAAGGLARNLGVEQALSFDMGGTTTDVCLILDGEVQVTSERELGGRPVRQPMVAVESIGAGGGSIARLDHGALVVGPESAGAKPRPACYALGGDQPTVTDANLVLGYMDPERLIGDGMRLDERAARAALDPIAFAMGVDVETAALGIIRVANSAMVRALRRVTVERGIDGRRCTLLAFGGAGPMHAVEVARAFSIDTVIVPAHSGVFSALGCAEAEMSYSRQRTLRMAVATGIGNVSTTRDGTSNRDSSPPWRRPDTTTARSPWRKSRPSDTAARAMPSSSPTRPSRTRHAWACVSSTATGASTVSRPRNRESWYPSGPGRSCPAAATKVRRSTNAGESRLGSGGCPARSLRGRKRRRHATTAPHSSPSAPSRDRSLSRTRGPRRWFRRGQP